MQVLLFIIIAFRGVEEEGAIERIFKIYRFLVANSFCGERAIVLHKVRCFVNCLSISKRNHAYATKPSAQFITVTYVCLVVDFAMKLWTYSLNRVTVRHIFSHGKVLAQWVGSVRRNYIIIIITVTNLCDTKWADILHFSFLRDSKPCSLNVAFCLWAVCRHPPISTQKLSPDSFQFGKHFVVQNWYTLCRISTLLLVQNSVMKLKTS